MANTFETPNMHMDLPVVQGEVGPLWAQELNTAIGTVIDAHDHTSGNGVQVPAAGIGIDDDLQFNGNQAVGLSGMGLNAVTQPSAGTSVATIYRTGDDLYWQDGSGANVRLTQGGAIVPNGTGAANGFYGTYAASVAHASYYNVPASYQFYQNSAETLRATGVFGQLQSINATQNDFYLATGGGHSGQLATSPTGGWRTRSTNTLLSWSNAGSGSSSYSTVMGLQPISFGFTGDFSLAVNDVTTDYALSVSKRTSGANFLPVAALRINWQGGGTVPTNLGSYLAFTETNESKTMGQLHTYYASKTTASNGAAVMCMMPTFNGGSPVSGIYPIGISVMRHSSTAGSASLAVGLMGLPVAGQGITAYGDLVPSASGGLLGTVSLPWAIQASTITSSGAVAVGTTLAVFSTSTFSDTMTTRNVIPNSTARDLGSSAAYWANFYTANTRYRSGANTQIQSFGGIVHHAISVSSGGSTVYEYTANNTCTVTKTGTGTYDLDFSTALPATQCLFFATFAESSAAGTSISVGQASTTKLQVTVRDGGAADRRFNVMILSTGF